MKLPGEEGSGLENVGVGGASLTQRDGLFFGWGRVYLVRGMRGGNIKGRKVGLWRGSPNW